MKARLALGARVLLSQLGNAWVNLLLGYLTIAARIAMGEQAGVSLDSDGSSVGCRPIVYVAGQLVPNSQIKPADSRHCVPP